MGAALGFALTASTTMSFAVFTCLGLGFAGPFLLLAYQPQWHRYLPKPGAWMLTFKKWMSLPMFLTALWLLSVFLKQLSGPAQKNTQWQKYSRLEVEKKLNQGNPVFIDFTAAWCITCQVNEKIALDKPEVQKKFAQKNVALFRADWTNRDTEITNELARYGRQGVPLYVLQKSSESAGDLWPQILTPGLVLSRLDQL
jgi:thiol:disulfide interchange protein DsbD